MSNLQLPDEYSWVDLSNPAFEQALDLCLNSDRNIFVQGKAGVGKSQLIRIIASMCKNVVVLSTTGTTAMELCTGSIAAKTIHSFLSIPPKPIFEESDFYMIGPKNRKFLDAAETIIIDEVSMMSNNLFDFICAKIKRKRQDHDIPRLILFGDVMQLPPVIDTKNPIIKDFYDQNYNGKIMFFNSNFFKSLKFKTIFLRKSYRQNDIDFADRLLEIGFKDHTQETLDYFNTRVMSLNKFETKHKQYIYMAPTNAMVDKMNNSYIKTLTGKSHIYKASMSTGFPKDKMSNAEEVDIRIGAQVMCTTNSPDATNPEMTYTNGMIGEVLEVFPDKVVIQLPNGNIRHIGKTTFTNYEMKINQNVIEYVPNGWFKQIDCRVARGITVHRSQGKSFDEAYMSLGHWVPPGLVYVGLSRLRTLEGLGISRNIVEQDIVANEESYDFLANP